MKNYVKTLRLMLLMLVGVSGYALADDTTGLVRGKVIGSGDTVEMESVDRGITYGAQVTAVTSTCVAYLPVTTQLFWG